MRRPFHTLCLAGLTIAIGLSALTLAGCGSDHGNALIATWILQDESNQPLSCQDAGATQVEIQAKNLQTNVMGPGFLFPCTAMAGRTGRLASGSYAVNVTLLDASGNVLSTTSTARIGVGGNVDTDLGEVQFTVSPVDASGNATFLASWTTAYVDASAATCDGLFAPTVELTATNTLTGVATVDSFPCNAGSGRSRALAPGSYAIVLTLKDTSNGDLSVADLSSGTDGTTYALAPSRTTAVDPVQFLVQSFVAQWGISKAGVAATCAAVGATDVSLTAQLVGSSQPAMQISFPCTAGQGASPGIPGGSYQVSFSLLNGTQVLSTVPTFTFATDDTKRATLPLVTFPLN